MARPHRERSRDREERDSEFKDKLVHINRVAKVVKGGKRFGFAALVVVGDQKGRVGYGHGKAREVPEAIRKATEEARRNLMRVPLREGRTLHHDSVGHHGAGRVVLRSAPPGTGVTQLAICFTSSVSASPTIIVSPFGPVTWLMPMSITAAPGLTMSACRNFGLPTATSTASARRECAATDRVM